MLFQQRLFLLVYLEIIYHIVCFGMTAMNPLLTLGLCVGAAGIEAFLLSRLKRKSGKILFWTLAWIDIVIYGAQIVYHRVFKQPLLLSAVINAGGDVVTNYWKETLILILGCWLPILLLLLPVPIMRICWKKRKKLSKKQHQLQRKKYLLGGLAGILIFSLGMCAGKVEGALSTQMYEDFSDPLAVFERYGVFASMQRNVHAMIFGNQSEEAFLELGETNPEQKPDEDLELPEGEKQPEPNVLPIDFAALKTKEERAAVKALHQFVEGRTPTTKNDYTGMFKGYNLIYLTAEGFAPYCVDEKITPTLYKLLHSGFQFENYYVPLWQTSTSDGEFVNCTGLLPDSQFSFKRSAQNAMPFVLPGFFGDEGVQSFGYHNNSLSYYDRYLTHENLGYFFKAGSPGKLSAEEWKDHLFQMEHPNSWPQSDLEMMQATLADYVNQPRFHAYYMTVSGHLQYTFTGNAMSAKNRDLVAGLPYSDRAKAYVACNIELDRALEWLITELDKAGKLENTVICLGADHYPYGLEESEIEELRGKPLEKERDLYHSGLILWNSEMESVVVDKPCSSMDILPTLLNLFGFNYDSRLYSGRDILSDSSPLVIFSDRSFLTDKVYYDAKTGQTENQNGEIASPEYVEEKIKQVKDLFTFSAGILNYDYYGTLGEIQSINK